MSPGRAFALASLPTSCLGWGRAASHLPGGQVASQPVLENREFGKKSLEFYKVVTTVRL